MTTEIDPCVTAILQNQRLTRQLDWHYADDGMRTTSPIQPAALQVAWRTLSDTERLIWTRLYGLDGQPPTSRKEVAALLTERGETRIQTQLDNIPRKLRLSLWPPNNFPGLSMVVANILLRASITTPEQVVQRINELFERRPPSGWGPARFRELEQWMTEHDHPSLVPLLTPSSKQAAGLE